MSRKTIFLVSSGEYSDYSVLGAFARREDADAAVAAGYGEEVEERVLYDEGELPQKQIRWYGRAAVWIGGPVEDPQAWSSESWDDQPLPLPSRPVVEVDRRPHMVIIRAEARSEQAALKATADRLAQIRAELNEPEVSDG